MSDRDPVAVVVVDTPLAHLDRPFEYSVPTDLLDAAVPGSRVKVRFAGRDLDGYVTERRAAAEHGGTLAPIRAVVSPEPVLTPELLALCRAVADRYAGTLSDVLRLAVPKRHARAEKALPLEPGVTDPGGAEPGVAEPGVAESGVTEPGAAEPGAIEPGPWSAYGAGPAWLRRVSQGESPAAAWTALPTRTQDMDWPRAIAVAVATAVSSGRGALVVLPDRRDVARVDAALRVELGPGRHVLLTADQGPQARYTAWLKVLRGHVPVAIGTRAAAFAPVHDLGLAVWWDDGDDLHQEPRAPYHHVREVMLLRAEQSGAALLTGGLTRSLAVQQLVEDGRLVPLEPSPAASSAAAARVEVAGEGADLERDGPGARAHLPSRAWRVAHDALADGPVLVQVPRRGYVPALSCAQCRAPVRCGRCGGPMAVGLQGATPACRWCGAGLPGGPVGFTCPECGSGRLRSSITGHRRTAEEIGRAFAGVPVLTSGAGEVLDTVPDGRALVIATPGAEPVAERGYSAVLLLDAWASLDLPVLDAGVESLRRWAAAAALVRPGRTVVLAGAPDDVVLPAVEALVRWAPVWLAERELADRRALGLPPAVTMADVRGPRRAVEAAIEQLSIPEGAQLLGPMPVGGADPDLWHVLLRTRPEGRARLAHALQAMRAVRSARKEPQAVTVRLDPADPV